MKDSKILFTSGQVYEFNSSDLTKALDFCRDKNILGIETPWGVLSLVDTNTFKNVMEVFND